MKLNISDPVSGNVKSYEIDDEKKLLPFYEKRIGAEVRADGLGEEFKNFVFRITGGNDKQGFPMMQGVLTNHRVRLLFKKGMPCYRERRKGSLKRKSVRGCIVAPDISALNLKIVQRGAAIQGLTMPRIPPRLGPKRANKIRRMFGLSKEDDVRKCVTRRVVKEGKKTKAPKIQRLITAERLRRKYVYRKELAARGEKTRQEAAAFKEVVAQYVAGKRAAAQAKKDEALKRKEKRQAKKTAKTGLAKTTPKPNTAN